MQTAEFNHEDFANQSEADKALMVRFFYKNVENKLESQKLGRPSFREKTYVEIRVAGQRDVQACRPATHADKQRFSRHFEAFEKRVEPPTEGMPLIEWPKITRTQAEELTFMNVKTVEQLASMKDSNLQQFMNGYKLRDQAVKWLETNSAETDDREKEELKASVAALQEQVQALSAMNKKSGPGVGTLDMESTKAITNEPVDENAAVPVPPAPGGVPKRTARKRNT
jgi:hypothetical protein